MCQLFLCFDVCFIDISPVSFQGVFVEDVEVFPKLDYFIVDVDVHVVDV